jgi:hypothetical protein
MEENTEVTLQHVNDLSDFIKAEKPEWMTGRDFAVMVVLLNENLKHPAIWLSQPTVARRAGFKLTAVKDAIKILKKKYWIKVVSGKRQQNTNLIEILYINLPRYAPSKPTIVSERAEKLAQGYRDVFIARFQTYTNKKGRKCRRPLRGDWLKRWAPVLQKRLDAGVPYNDIVQHLNWTAENKPKQFIAGPQAIIWPATGPAKEGLHSRRDATTDDSSEQRLNNTQVLRATNDQSEELQAEWK